MVQPPFSFAQAVVVSVDVPETVVLSLRPDPIVHPPLYRGSASDAEDVGCWAQAAPDASTSAAKA
jgi:hypothetical protein